MIFWFIKYKLNNRKSRNKNLEMVSGLRGSNPGRNRVATGSSPTQTGREEHRPRTQNPTPVFDSGGLESNKRTMKGPRFLAFSTKNNTKATYRPSSFSLHRSTAGNTKKTAAAAVLRRRQRQHQIAWNLCRSTPYPTI